MGTAVKAQMKAVQKPSTTNAQTGLLQRKCDRCRKKKILQRSAVGSAPDTVPPIVHEVLRSCGQPLDAATRAFMEPRFGHDFSQVRVHADARAAESARVVDALAYTVGSEVVFGAGKHEPRSDIGRRLIAHELTHVVQQSQGIRLQPQNAMSKPGDASEREADLVAGNLLSYENFSIPRINPTEVQVSRKEPKGDTGSTLPYREATEMANCVRIMGEANEAYCRQTVLGEPPTPAIPRPSPGASTSGSGKSQRVLNMERLRRCIFTVTYANQRQVDCDTAWKKEKGANPPKPLCGASLVYDIVSVRADGSGCPAKLEGLKVSENTKGNHGCTPPDFTWPNGSCIIGPGGKVTRCTDTFTLCGFASDLKGDCTEVVDQEIEVNGQLAEEHEIEFNLKKGKKSCTGTVRRN
jgi:hypothetical protein